MNPSTEIQSKSTKKFRVGVAGLSCECCTFSPLLSGERDFIVSAGAELAANYSFFADYPDVEFTALRRARALPGGSIEPTFYDGFKQRLLDELAANGPWDGIFLDMHGAANVYGRDDVEGDMLAAIRAAVGPDCLISASYDLHGNISPRVIASLNMLTAYRTAPHLDWFETLERALCIAGAFVARGTFAQPRLPPCPHSRAGRADQHRI